MHSACAAATLTTRCLTLLLRYQDLSGVSSFSWTMISSYRSFRHRIMLHYEHYIAANPFSGLLNYSWDCRRSGMRPSRDAARQKHVFVMVYAGRSRRRSQPFRIGHEMTESQRSAVFLKTRQAEVLFSFSWQAKKLPLRAESQGLSTIVWELLADYRKRVSQC